jgi:hypothetical protein
MFLQWEWKQFLGKQELKLSMKMNQKCILCKGGQHFFVVVLFG